jgi:MarR family transcriptional regulator, lower aerobic nicotinate degradation pathway regulator
MSIVGATPRLLEAIASLPVINQPTHRIGARLEHLARRMRSYSESTLAALDMRPRHLLTLTVLRDLGGSTQQALATHLSIDRTNLVGLLNELESEGLIERRRSPEDRRRHIVEVTPAGREALAKAEFALAAVEDEVLAALDTEQREALYQLLVQATGDLSAGLPSSC